MEIKQLQSFVAVVEYGNFTKAAEKTFTSQPTISTHIRALEDELGEKLITRDTKHIEITPKGRELYECATHILDLQNNLIRRWREENHKTINLGASTVPSAYILPEIMADYSLQNPDVSFTISQGDSEEVAEGLENGLYDLGFLGIDCSGDKLDCEEFFSDETVIITPNTEKFREMQKAPQVPYAELLKEPIIFREKGSGSQRETDYLLEQMGYSQDSLNIAARVNDQETIKNLVEAGVGISLMPLIAIRHRENNGRSLVFRLPAEYSVRKFYIAVNRSSIKGEAVKHFMKFVKQNAR
ncbi:MAG: LysR family transcriptional regulator [Firmicutes bacterium]|nr:LysR family transcriptional regulator [Bacillota bacterium]